MSKQHLADMLKSIASGDMEAAKAHFSTYSTEKSQEILARGEASEETEEPAAPEVTPEPTQPVEEPTPTPAVEEPTNDDTTE